MNVLEDFIHQKEENKKMKTIFSKLHFDKTKKPKTLKIAVQPPVINQEYGSLKEGSIVISILAKEASQGFLMDAGSIGDLIYTLERAQKEIQAETYTLAEEVR